ncbi:hypothetical protein SANA_25510 [Gottschalkiaceae bacterium SANA]|nr:hypothetical protein SANA_25510 [Gottschalkiaceae bacterium SANA]
MSNQLFMQAKKKYFKKLDQYVAIVARVHGGSHPEFHHVREVYDLIVEKNKAAEGEPVGLDTEFQRLRQITDDYSVPIDVCESYEEVYKMLAELDQAYHS